MTPIRWLKRDAIKLGKYVRKFNAAITRMEKVAPELKDSGVLPLRMSVGDIKSGVNTRADLNRIYHRIDRFFRKGARDIVMDAGGAKVTRWEYKERRLAVRRANLEREKARKKYKVEGQKAAAVHLNPINLEKFEKEQAARQLAGEDVSQTFDNFLYSLNRESKGYFDENFMKVRPSYYKTIRQEIGGEEAEILIHELEARGVTGVDILNAIAQNDSFDFDFIYGPEDAQAKFELLMSLIPEYFGKYEDPEDDIDLDRQKVPYGY